MLMSMHLSIVSRMILSYKNEFHQTMPEEARTLSSSALCTYGGDDEGVSDVCRVVDAEPDDEDDGDAGDGVDGQAPEVDQPHHVHQRERHARQHHQANLEAEGRN